MLVHSTSLWHQFILVILAEENSGNILVFKITAGHITLVGVSPTGWQPQTINLYDGFVCQDDVVVVAVTSDYRLERTD